MSPREVTIYISFNKTKKDWVVLASVVETSGVNFIKKKLSKKSYPQISEVKNIIQKSYPKTFLSK